jgi:phosphodiesterase/alkaline phosphatase D-like protein
MSVRTESLALKNFEQTLKEVMDALKKRYPDAIILLRDEIYEDEDINLDIYVESEDILSVGEEISRVVFDLTKETDFLILPNIAPMEFCPVKQ